MNPFPSLWLDAVLDWFAGLLVDTLGALIGVITDVLLVSPDVTALPQVQALTGRAVWVVDTVFVLVFMAAGVLTMVAGSNENIRYEIKDLLPRCVVGFVAAHFSQLIASNLIGFANAVTAALTDQDLDRARSVEAIKAHLSAGREVSGGLLFVVCLSIILVLLAATACSVIVRFTLLLVLTAGAPLALMLHALPQTDPVARLWWRTYLGVLAVPVCQGAVLFAAQWILLDPAAMVPQLGLPTAEPGGVLNLFVVMVMLWLTVKVPTVIHRYTSTAGRGGNVLGAAVRVVVVQQLTRGLRVPGLRAATR
ncbi:hypothetical protein [Actinoplanes sp. M2I2]|uniref:hypothetical protein n=1 Tax=Actinoplanes sp. M2I2 TaxID=1734444 RepID=UPI0020203D16|nr:hypothetical protein [Actinoplanes sp. M2I2]